MDNKLLCSLNLVDDNLYNSLDDIEELERYPWIGKNYLQNRILILGDSHYATSKEAEKDFKNPHSTIEIIKAVIEKGPYSFYNGLYNLFNLETQKDIEEFWSNIAFYNFVQEIMKDVHQKPSPTNRMKAWRCLAEVSKVLQPTFILFLGIRNWYGTHALEGTDTKCELEWDKTIKISKVTPAYGRLILPQGDIPFSIIRHTAMGFNAPAWREYLQSKVPIRMSALIL
jgi:hypothetical protein